MHQRLSQVNDEEGFTLFELLIVIIILAILAGIVVFSVGTTNAGALTSSCQTDARSFESAIEQYNTQVGHYPPLGPLPVGQAGYVPYTALTTPQTVDGQIVGPFLRQLPATNHYQIVTDGAGNVYVYPSAPAHIPIGAGAMANTDVGLEAFGNSAQDTAYMNFETNSSICSDSNVVS